MLDSVHVVLWPAVLNQAHCASDMSWHAGLRCTFHALRTSDNGLVEVQPGTYLESKEQNHRYER